MLMYPLPLLSNSVQVSRLLGDQISGEPYIFDFSSNNPTTLEYNASDFDRFQQMVFSELEESQYTWGIGCYLEERANVLRNYPQMVDSNRIYHAGLDIIVPEGFTLYAPIDGTVHLAGKENGIGNYGGYVVLRHHIGSTIFYSMYGHLNANHIVDVGQKVQSGESFAAIGDGNDSGGWFTHTHLQIITEEAGAAGNFFKGYVSPQDLPMLHRVFPSPYPMFRY